MQKGDVKWGLETYVAHEQSEVMGKWTLSILNHSSVASINRSSTSYVNQRKEMSLLQDGQVDHFTWTKFLSFQWFYFPL